MTNSGFKTDQLKFPRVREAYSEKESQMKALLAANAVDINDFAIYLRAFKEEDELELWAKSESQSEYKLIKTYRVCKKSGSTGPKRKQGDMQVPEGFYHIDRFNPKSKFHLSLGINYPNKSDKILSDKDNPGGDIFIHGACQTVGCLPITDDQIKELYVFCVEASKAKQTKIPVTLFPCRLSLSNFAKLKAEHVGDNEKIGLWTDLKVGYDAFNKSKKLPQIGFLNNGRCVVDEVFLE